MVGAIFCILANFIEEVSHEMRLERWPEHEMLSLSIESASPKL